MLKMKQENKNRINKSIEKDLLLQGYARYVSRAHTIFSTFFDIVLAVIFGTLGIVVSLVELKIIQWNKYYFSIFVLVDISIVAIISSVFLFVFSYYPFIYNPYICR